MSNQPWLPPTAGQGEVLLITDKRALKLLKLMPLPQEENTFLVQEKKIIYFAFEAVVENRRIKVIVRQVGNGKKHFWSVIPAWRRIRGRVTNAGGGLDDL